MARKTAVDQVERILAVLPWIVENQPVHVNEVCERFELSARELLADLDYVFHHVGVYPFTPDTMTDVYIDEDIIEIHLGDYFRRPLKLNVTEALGLLTAAQALTQRSEIDADGVLQRAVNKLEAVLAPGLADAWRVDLGPGQPEVMRTLHDAVQAHHVVDLRYYSHNSNEVKQRRVHPLELLSKNGWWYLEAWCDNAREVRTFRVDRVQQAITTTQTFEPSDSQYGDRTSGVSAQSNQERFVELKNMRSPHLVEALVANPGQSRDDNDSSALIAPLMSTGWLERVLLIAGPHVDVHDTSTHEDLRHIGAQAAERVLGRYGDSPSSRGEQSSV